MSDVILVENLGKKYLLNHQAGEGSYVALRDVLTKGARNLGRRLLGRGDARQDAKHEQFWALQEVSFQVPQGGRIGIIGRNGAGKSTLLKILSRITEPSTGSVRIRGRVASLLEVGTGFHPELTGRENIYLNGAILGMARAEIKKKFDEIVDFAEIEKFLDTPVKRYSSGMYVRLAFAVAAHLEPEILIVDEVLAVGDAQFQKKCLGKMEAVSAREGRTVLFVSHNMAAISSLCTTGLLLDGGKLVSTGNVSDVVLSYYSQGIASPSSFNLEQSSKSVGDSYAGLLSGAVTDLEGKVCPEAVITEPVAVVMRYRISCQSHFTFQPNFHFFSSDGAYAFVSAPQHVDAVQPGVYQAECRLPANFLNEGTYFVGLALTSLESGVRVHFYEQNALSFNVKDPLENVPTRNGYSGPIPGIVRPRLDWQIKNVG